MVMADQDDVDRRQIVPGYSELGTAVRAGRRQRTGPVRPDRSRRNVATAMLQQNGGVIHQRSPKRIALDPALWFGRLDVGNKFRRTLRTAGQFPTDDVKQAECLRSIG